MWQRLLDVTCAGPLDETAARDRARARRRFACSGSLAASNARLRSINIGRASEGRWEDASAVAGRLDRDDQLSVSIVFLLAQHTTSGAADSAWARAMSAVAASLVGLEQPTARVEGEIVRLHGATLIRFLAAQRTLTLELLRGIDVVLHRAVRLDPVPGEGEFDPRHRILDGHSLDPDQAPSLAIYGLDASSYSGQVVLLSGRVPTERILSPPATGFGLRRAGTRAAARRRRRPRNPYPRCLRGWQPHGRLGAMACRLRSLPLSRMAAHLLSVCDPAPRWRSLCDGSERRRRRHRTFALRPEAGARLAVKRPRRRLLLSVWRGGMAFLSRETGGPA